MKKFLLIGLLLITWGAAYSQATITPDPPTKVNACGGLPNGSITFTIATGTAPFSILYFGLGFGQSGVVPATLGTPVTIPGLQADTYLLAISDGDGANPNYSTFVTISNIPAVSATLNSKADNSSCSSPNGTISITPSGGTGTYNYAWSSTNGFGPFPNSNSLVGLPGGQYSVDITDPGSNCVFTFGPVTIADPSPVVQTVSTTSPEIVCSTSTATISLANSQVLTLPGSYYEVVKNGTPTGVKASGTGGPITLTLAAGTFSNGDVLTVRAVDGLCTPALMSGSVTLTVNSSPTSAVLSGTTTVCSGTAANLKVTITGGTGPFSVTIDNGVGTINNYASGTNIPVNPAATTTYNLISVTDASGCPPPALSGTPTVTVNNGPTSGVLSGTATICRGTPTNLVVTITGGTGPYSFTINGGVGLKTNYVSGTPIPVSPTTSRTYTITGNITDANGCTVAGTGSAIVTVNIPPTSATLSLNGVGTICAGQSTTLKVVIVGGTGPFNFTITGLGPQTGYVSGTPITVTPAITTSYSLAGNTVTDSKTCTVVGTGATSVTVNPLPTATVVAAPTAICAGSSSTLTFTMTGTAPFDVQYSDGTTTSSFTTGSLTQNVPVSPSSTKTYTITSIVDATTCPGVAGSNALVSVNTPPSNATLSGTTTVCSSTSANLSVTITGGTGPYSITIDNGVGTINSYVSGTSIPVSPSATTTYNLTAVTDANGCPAVAITGSAVVTVNPSPTAATLGGTASICAGSGPVNIFATITGGTSPYTITINNGVGTINNYVSGTAIPVNPSSTTTYAFTGTITDANGCGVSSASTVTITVNTPPSNATLSGVATVCAGTPASLSVTITGGASPYNVTINNGVGTISSYVSGSAINVSPLSTTTYSLTSVTDANGCNALALAGSGTITVTPLATASISGSATICVGGSSSLTVSLTGTGPWDLVYTDGSSNFPVNGIVTSPASIPVSPLVSTTYSLVSVTNAACGPGTVSGTSTVNVNPIGGNPAVYGVDTWLGYIYTDAGDATPIPARINFAASKYRGVIDETDIAGMTPFSSYNTATDAFDLNIQNEATGFTVHAAAMCGAYSDTYSARFRMRKTFTQGVYTFTVGGDDGVRMTLDGVTIIPGGFSNHSYQSFTSAAQCLTAGTHDLVIEYFENSGFSRVTFDFQAAASPVVTTPVSTCVNAALPTLTASSPDVAVTGFKWYKDNTLTTLLFTGANFTPASADLDMTVVATTSFFVTATYACGETLASQVDVNVVSGATITLPPSPAQVCQTGGIVDLTTIVSASPGGGSFTFTGTGITTSPNFDPTLVSGSTTISVSYTSGTCMANTSFNIGIVASATVTVPSTSVAVCQSSTPIDITTLVSASPAGGSFTFTGAGVTGSTFDPSAQSGTVPVTVGYNVGGCTDSKVINFDVSNGASIFTNNGSTCPTGGPFNLLSLVSATPPGGTFTFSGPGVTGTTFDPSAHASSSVTISVGYNLGGCTAAGTLSVAVSASCVGGVNCGAFTVLINDTRPSCSNPTDGIIAMSITGGVAPYIVSLTDGGSFNKTLPGSNPVFSSLSPANYFYTITDNGGNTCTLPFSLPVNTSVQATATSFTAATCFNQPTGGATLAVTSGGAAPYEYSADGGMTWTVFTSPATVNNLMPSLSDYSILIRDDASDPCPAQVLVHIDNAIEILAPYTSTPATCANNDGSIQLGTISGGVAPYTFKMDGVPLAALPTGNTFSNLTGGTHTFNVTDATMCSHDFAMVVTFPGLVNFSTSTVNPDCTGNGTNGSLTVLIVSVGQFDIGISTDPSIPPATTINKVSDGTQSVTFNGLSKGTYYVTAMAVGAQCPTVTPATITGGPEAVDFTILNNNIICFGDAGGITLQGITGSPSVPYNYEILQLGNPVLSGSITIGQALGDVPFTGLSAGNYQVRLFQDQSVVNGCVAPITSAAKQAVVVGPTAELDTLSVKTTISYPDLPTGSLLVAIKESGESPYEVKLVSTLLLDPDKSFALDWTEASRNGNNLLIEYKLKNLYAGSYELSIRDSLGCEKTYPVTIGVDSDIFIPNVFTPNGDQKNEIFYIRNKPDQTSVVITNRWGKEVYRNGNYDNAWAGDGVDDGVYYYHITANGQTFNGWLEIQRGQ